MCGMLVVDGVVVSSSYSTERCESYTPDVQRTATLDLKHRRRNPTSPTPTYDSAHYFSPDVVFIYPFFLFHITQAT